MSKDTSDRSTTRVSGYYMPASVSEALRLERHGFGDIMYPKVLEAVKTIENCQHSLWEAQRKLRDTIRDVDI